MRLSTFAAAVLSCLIGIPPVASAQSVPPALGARVRLTTPCALVSQPVPERRNWCVLVGKLLEWRADSIDLEVKGDRRSYNLSTESLVEVSRGFRSRTRQGAVIGFVVGAGSTFLLFHTSGSTDPCDASANQDAIGSAGCLGIYALGGLAGAGLGALIGSRIRTERWQMVTQGRVRISLVAQRRLTLRLAVVF